MGLAFAVMWSSAFTSARILVADAAPIWTLAIRFVVAGLIGVGVGLATGGQFRLSRAQWLAVVIFGICQNALYLGLNFVAMQTVTASVAAIVASTMPLLVAVASLFGLSERLRPVGVLGLVAGFAGVALVMGSRISAGVDLFGLGLCVVGVLALTMATLAMRGTGSGGNVMTIVGLQMIVGAIPLTVYAVVNEPFFLEFGPTWGLAFAYTTLVPGLLATWVWFQLVNRIGPVRAATFHFLNPFLGVAIAAILLGERLGTRDVMGVAIIAGGILIVQLSRPLRR